MAVAENNPSSNETEKVEQPSLDQQIESTNNLINTHLDEITKLFPNDDGINWGSNGAKAAQEISRNGGYFPVVDYLNRGQIYINTMNSLIAELDESSPLKEELSKHLSKDIEGLSEVINLDWRKTFASELVERFGKTDLFNAEKHSLKPTETEQHFLNEDYISKLTTELAKIEKQDFSKEIEESLNSLLDQTRTERKHKDSALKHAIIGTIELGFSIPKNGVGIVADALIGTLKRTILRPIKYLSTSKAQKAEKKTSLKKAIGATLKKRAKNITTVISDRKEKANKVHIKQVNPDAKARTESSRGHTVILERKKQKGQIR